MSNFCSTSYRFYSENESELKRFYKFLSELYMEAKTKGIVIKKNGVEETHRYINYYLMQERLNIPTEKMVISTGDVINVDDIYRLGKYFVFDVEMMDINKSYPEVFRNIIDKRFVDISIAYKAENPADDIMEIHDDTGLFFHEKYAVDLDLSLLAGTDEVSYRLFWTKKSAVRYLYSEIICKYLPEEAKKELTNETDPFVLANNIQDFLDMRNDTEDYIRIFKFRRV